MEATILLVDDYHGHYVVQQLIDRYKEDLFLKGLNSIGFCSYNEKRDTKEAIEESIDASELYIRVDKQTNDLWPIDWHSGALIAVNPLAEHCTSCDAYHVLSGNVTRYQVGSHFLAALINGDLSGLSEEESSELAQFEDNETYGIENWHWSYMPEHSEEFAECEITRLMGNTVELHLVTMDRA